MNAATTTPAQHERPRRFAGRFRATRVLRSGPDGETLRGVDTEDGSGVVIRTVLACDPAAAERVEEELGALLRLGATGLVHPVAAGRQGAVLYAVHRYVPGTTLEARLVPGGRRLDVADALTVARAVLGALAAAHAHGLLHGDVRPSNVVVAGSTVPGHPLEVATPGRLRRLPA
ncbi:MAG: hypothetical protein M3203_12350, partial [Actinomycetota bacterium]|nr:hypothetical protein [Actinomycetota bacterium]